jgi:hypothetical protein
MAPMIFNRVRLPVVSMTLSTPVYASSHCINIVLDGAAIIDQALWLKKQKN